jgi:hypothetical protein
MSLLRKKDGTEHQYVEERLSAYLDGELSSQDREAVDRHLAICRHCQWNLETLRQTVQWTRALPTVTVPRTFMIPIQAKTIPEPRWRWGMPLLQGATAMVAVLFFLAVAGNAYFTRPTQVSQPPAAVAVEMTREEGQVVALTVEVEMLPAAEPSIAVEKAVSEEVAAAAPEAPAPGGQIAEAPEEMPLAASAAEAGATDAGAFEAQEAPVEAATSKAEDQPVQGETQADTGLEKPTANMQTTATPIPQARSEAAPTEVAKAVAGGAEPALAEAEQAPSGAAQEPMFAWLGAVGIALGVAFVLLGTVTIFLMVRRIRAT